MLCNPMEFSLRRSFPAPMHMRMGTGMRESCGSTRRPGSARAGRGACAPLSNRQTSRGQPGMAHRSAGSYFAADFAGRATSVAHAGDGLLLPSSASHGSDCNCAALSSAGSSACYWSHRQNYCTGLFSPAGPYVAESMANFFDIFLANQRYFFSPALKDSQFLIMSLMSFSRSCQLYSCRWSFSIMSESAMGLDIFRRYASSTLGNVSTTGREKHPSKWFSSYCNRSSSAVWTAWRAVFPSFATRSLFLSTCFMGGACGGVGVRLFLRLSFSAARCGDMLKKFMAESSFRSVAEGSWPASSNNRLRFGTVATELSDLAAVLPCLGNGVFLGMLLSSASFAVCAAASVHSLGLARRFGLSHSSARF
mmetsp:Transcript_25630/g.60994  ORF Transcript_25630/g.60994 Transcript_25630/m.60994 type:complete len:365 (+) Transcript_25630:84-1178(+)